MARHVIFAIHGMGDHDAHWGDSVAATLKGLYDQYDIADLGPFDDQFVVKSLYYNDKFDDLRERWASAANEVLSLMKPGASGGGALAELTAWAGSANKKTFLRTHVLDVLLYRFFPTVASQVRSAVRLQLIEGMGGAKKWSAIGHSLGTSVLHDALVEIFDPSAPGRLKQETSRFEVLAMVANVSRVLESSDLGSRWDVYRSVVQPNVKVTKGVCNTFLNVCHNWDPIPVPKKFKPTADWPDAATRAVPGVFQDIRIDEIEKGSKVHDLEHYLRNPNVHIPLFRSLLAISGVVSAEEEMEALDAHRAHHPRAKAQQEIDRLKNLRLSDEDHDWKRILAMIHKYFA